jgi:hypothetical protein
LKLTLKSSFKLATSTTNENTQTLKLFVKDRGIISQLKKQFSTILGQGNNKRKSHSDRSSINEVHSEIEEL